MTEPNSARRLAVVGVLVLALFAGLLTRLWFLQVTGGEKLAVAAQRERDPLRARCRPSAGTHLRPQRHGARRRPCRSRRSWSTASGSSSTERTKLETNLAALLATKSAEPTIAKLIDNPSTTAFESVPVAKDVDTPTAVYVTEHRADFPEVSVSTTTRASLPAGLPGRRRRRLPRTDQRRGVQGARERRLPRARHDREDRRRGDRSSPSYAARRARTRCEVDNQGRAVERRST